MFILIFHFHLLLNNVGAILSFWYQRFDFLVVSFWFITFGYYSFDITTQKIFGDICSDNTICDHSYTTLHDCDFVHLPYITDLTVNINDACLAFVSRLIP